jgi:methionine-rich copper-binding protein CopC
MMTRAAGIGALAMLALAVTPPGPAHAHAVLVKSDPGSRAALGHPPDRVRLWFNERLEAAFSTVSVWSESGLRVDRQDAAVGPEDAKRLSVTLPPIEPGIYTVRFRVLSVDGHIVDSSFRFTVKPR